MQYGKLDITFTFGKFDYLFALLIIHPYNNVTVLHFRSNYRYRDMKFAAKTSSLSLKVHAKDNGENTDVSKMSDNASSQLTASTNDKLSTRDFTNLSYSLLNSSQSVSLHDMSDLREPLLEK